MTTPQLTDDELQDLAHSAYEEAMSLGLSVDTFLRYFKGIRKRATAPALTHKAEDAPSDAELLDWLMRKLPGYVSLRLVGRLSDTGDMEEFRAAIRAAIAQERKA